MFLTINKLDIEFFNYKVFHYLLGCYRIIANHLRSKPTIMYFFLKPSFY